MPDQLTSPAAPRSLTPTVLAWLGVLGAAVAPTVQFVNGYWQNQLKQTEIAHQIALDFAKLAISDKASREYRRDTLGVIASIRGNPLQTWAEAELRSVRAEQKDLKAALRSRLEGPRYTTMAECQTYLEQQFKVQNFLVAETFDRKDMKDALGVTVKDQFIITVERDCRDLETGVRPATAVVANKGPRPASAAAAAVVVASARPRPASAAAAPAVRACAGDNGNPLQGLTEAKLALIYPRARPADIVSFLPLLRQGMARAEINTCSRAAMFFAQIGQESAELRFTEEVSSGVAYEGRIDLGNIQPGDGALFKGRGLVLITGRANYRAFSVAINRPDVMSNPALVGSVPDLALEAALWFWTSRNLNMLTDNGDVRAVTRRINGGYNGLEQRNAYLAAAKAVL